MAHSDHRHQNNLRQSECEVLRLTDEAERLRTALNNLIGAIVNKKIAGLEDDLEEARAALVLE